MATHTNKGNKKLTKEQTLIMKKSTFLFPHVDILYRDQDKRGVTSYQGGKNK